MEGRRVLITARTFGKVAAEPLERLRREGLEIVEVREGRGDDEAEFREALENADALLVGARPVTAEALARARRLRVIAKHGVGVDNIDLQAATERGIAVVSTPGANDQSVADLAFGLLLAVARHIPEADRSMKGGRWERFTGRGVWGKRLAVVGLGRIGRGVVQRARGFDMEVQGYDVRWPEEFARANGVVYRPWPDILREADFVSLHLPLCAETVHLIGRAELAAMKRGAILINTARGRIVDEAALYEALVSGHLAGAGIDVWEDEPPGDNPLVKLENVVATPHSGAHTYEAAELMGVMAVEGILDVLAGRRPVHLVNPEIHTSYLPG
ncbi:MAG: phosphoglycerate dehydrogenase [Bacillota bacterium]|nr:phosphoglycerate dehydrogenase [Bacillota bacterium]